MAPNIGAVQPRIGLGAAPDVNNRRRLFAWMRRANADMSGASGGVIGYDRGDAMHSFNGPVTLVPSPERAVYLGTSSEQGVYRPRGEFQNSISTDPGLDPFHRNMYARLGQAGVPAGSVGNR